jgi:hypothetical protein
MVRVLITICFALSVVLCQAEPASDVTPAIAYQLAPYAPIIPSIRNLQFQYVLVPRDNHHSFTVHTASWEIRDADHFHRIAQFPAQMYFYAYDGINDARPPHPEGLRYDFGPDDLRNIGELAPGNYVMALLINGVRVSNVITFKIDPAFDLMKAPALTCGMIEAPPGQKTGSLLAWAVGPTPEDPYFTNEAVSFPDIVVDGKMFKNEGINWVGPVGPYHSGAPDVRIYFQERLKGIDLNKPHDFSLIVQKYLSATVLLDLSSHTLARAWDAQTANLGAEPVKK